MFVYAMGPIDDWTGWRKPEELFRARIDTSAAASPMADDDPHGDFEPHRWAQAWTSARAGARELHWEGDIRPGEGPFVTMLPSAEPGVTTPFIIAWKQDNNGMTFIASPFRLPWLEIDGTQWLVHEN